MNELKEALWTKNEYQMTCSVGITFVVRNEFVYSECMKQADIALYKSKEKGKNTYSYFEEV